VNTIKPICVKKSKIAQSFFTLAFCFAITAIFNANLLVLFICVINSLQLLIEIKTVVSPEVSEAIFSGLVEYQSNHALIAFRQNVEALTGFKIST
jgi:hypothetical protein